MKCSKVQENLEEYVDGALGPVDEMCIDIHLIQCESCRAEIHGLRRLLGGISGEIRNSRHGRDDVRFLMRFRALREDEARPRPIPLTPRRLVFARAIAVAVTVALVLTSGLFGHETGLWSPKPIEKVHAGNVTASEWEPYLRQTGNLIDLFAMGLVDNNTQPTMD